MNRSRKGRISVLYKNSIKCTDKKATTATTTTATTVTNATTTTKTASTAIIVAVSTVVFENRKSVALVHSAVAAVLFRHGFLHRYNILARLVCQR